jgi:hypothetical protein
MNRTTRLLLVTGLALAILVVALILPRIPQDPEYHNFADRRFFLGIPNFSDVVSNLPLFLVGALGLGFLWRQRRMDAGERFIEKSELLPYAVFFAGILFTSLTSAFYHLAPDNGRLAWDRLPMTLVFVSFFAAVIAERINLKAGLALLLPLSILGPNSVIYWNLSEMRGVGDLRLYLLLQFGPMLIVPLIILLFPARYTRTPDLWGVLGFYAVAKVFEVLDGPIFSLGHLVSGHTLKHGAAALAVYWMLRMLHLRRPVQPEQ